MPRKSPLKSNVVPDNPIPQRERSMERLHIGRERALAVRRANGDRFTVQSNGEGAPRNRIQGPMPVRLESLLMQVGPPAVAFLQDVITGVIPGSTLQQRIDCATTAVTMMAKVHGDQMSAYALLTRSLDVSKLNDAQLAALQRHQDDVGAMVAALVESTEGG